jgi:hypothetical protein
VFYTQGRKLNLIFTPQNAVQPMIQVEIKATKVRLKNYGLENEIPFEES